MTSCPARVCSIRRTILKSAPPRRALTWTFAGLLVSLSAWQFWSHLLQSYPYAVDLEIPLRAAERFAAGGEPYLASAFLSPPGPTQPFLYPPYLLPLLVPLTNLPREFVQGTWSLILLAVAVLTCRRLGLGRLTPVVLLWPPFSEPLYGGNVQILAFAAFVALFYRRKAEEAPQQRELASPRESGVHLAFLASAVAVLKVSQPHAWLYLLRERPRAALGGLLGVALVAAGTLPLVGLSTWLDWVAQLRRAQDPSWEMAGYAVSNFLPVIGLGVSATCVAMLWISPRRDAGAWVGILATVGAFSLHIFGLLFLLPAMLRIPREVALVAALFVATYSYAGSWAGIALVALTFTVASIRRLPGQREAEFVSDAVDPTNGTLHDVREVPSIVTATSTRTNESV